MPRNSLNSTGGIFLVSFYFTRDLSHSRLSSFRAVSRAEADNAVGVSTRLGQWVQLPSPFHVGPYIESLHACSAQSVLGVKDEHVPCGTRVRISDFVSHMASL